MLTLFSESETDFRIFLKLAPLQRYSYSTILLQISRKLSCSLLLSEQHLSFYVKQHITTEIQHNT